MDSLPLIVPPRITFGDTIGLVAPASSTERPERIDEVIAHLEKQGIRIKASANLRQRTGYLAGTDAERASDLNAMFLDPEVKAIFALRGGYGLVPPSTADRLRGRCARIRSRFSATATSPRCIWRWSHGRVWSPITVPTPNEAFQVGNEAALRRALMEPAREAPLFARGLRGGEALRVEVPGRARGRLLGGNMTCLLRLIGTPYAPDFEGAILFLEDIGEKAYRVDGMFAHLRLAGVLDRICRAGAGPVRSLRARRAGAHRNVPARGSGANRQALPEPRAHRPFSGADRHAHRLDGRAGRRCKPRYGSGLRVRESIFRQD